MIKKLFLIIMLFVLLVTFSSAALESNKFIDTYSKDYYVTNGFKETGSKNIVTGIYLDYRLFDSIFEASILLIAVTGIVFVCKRNDQVI